MIIKDPQKWIEKNDPCSEAVVWWRKFCRKKDPVGVLNHLIKEKRYDWANWFIVRVMSYRQYVSYAVYAAEQVIDIYEKKHLGDRRPRQAIDAAKKCIEDPSEENRAAAWAAGAARATEAAWAAAGAARAAAGAARAAGAAGAAEDAREKMQLKILKYGMKLLKQT